MWEFEGELEFVWVMGGLTRSYERGHPQVISQWLDDAAEGGMPCDPRIWTENPLESTYPACQAVKAATERGWRSRLPLPPHTLREGIMFERPRHSTTPMR